MMPLLYKHDSQTLFKESFFEPRQSAVVGLKFLALKPVASFVGDQKIELGYNVGTRPNGVDLPKWPRDLNTEVVKE
jgi:hypothetical protein